MADTKISALPSGAPAQAGDEYVVARSGANYKLTLTNIAATMPPIGASTPNTGAFTTLTASGNLTLNGGTANGVLYLNGSKVATSGSALVFDGTTFSNSISGGVGFKATATSGTSSIRQQFVNTGGTFSVGLDASNGAIFGANYAGVMWHDGNYPLVFGVNNAEGMRLTSTGLGIGTASPANKLQVNISSATAYSSGATGNGLTLYNTSTTNNQYVGIVFQGEPTAGNGGLATIYGTTTSSGNMDLTFSTRGSSTLAERMRIDSSGNVGIGTTSPGANKVNITSNVAAQPQVLALVQGYAGLATDVQWYNANNTTSTTLITKRTDGGLWLYQSGANYIAAYTNNTERMRLDSSGNLGLGVTPSAWGSAYNALQMGNGLSLFSTKTGTPSFYLSSNAYFDTGYKYQSNGFASEYYQFQGTHVWRTAASGTAGNTITFTQAMTLDASGNLGVGTTSPLDRLDVVSGSSTNRNRVRNSTSDEAFFLFQNSTTGTTTSSGLAVGIDSSENAYLYNYINSPLIFATNSTERARITAAGELLVGVNTATANGGVIQVSNGITFPATQSAASNANTLDDYEEGTWQGSFSPGTSGTITINTSDDTGAYTKIGRQVTVTGNFQVTSVASPVGSVVLINGLPFTIGDGTETSQRGSGSVMYYDNSTATVSVRPVDYIEAQTSFRVWLDAATVEANDSFTFTVTYFV